MSGNDSRRGIGRVQTSGPDFNADAEVASDGRAKINLYGFRVRASTAIAHRQDRRPPWSIPTGGKLAANNKHYETESQSTLGKLSGTPSINIAIFIVGSRGDVQPFIPIGQILSKAPYNHRVRICTHPVFKSLVEENGLEFFSIGGDPATLMAYMVKNPGLMPGIDSLKAGDVGKRRADISEILEGCWRACIEPGNGMGEMPRVSAKNGDQLFIAEAIISNPPSYAHIHCAEKLGIPLHVIFTMPWSPTQAFPHPLASLDRDADDPTFANYISYTMMELLAWQGLGDVINKFRTKTLHLDPISPLWGHALLSRMKIPFTYAWSSALIPKPADWGSHINISGFSFLPQASLYKPADDLVAFLTSGPPPVYIGFGSIVVENPNRLTEVVFGAVKRAGVRALVSKGWGGLGGNDPPKDVFLLGNVPHDWLFQHVSAVIHHGGAGTTAIGIALGKPTVVVPFFGDQAFWGAMVARAGAGPEPIPFKKMTEESLAYRITTALSPEIQAGVKRMSEKIAREDGASEAAKTFNQTVNMDSMRCTLSPDRVAVWRIKKTNIRLSALASAVLIEEKLLHPGQLKLVRHMEWYTDEGAADPITGILAFASGTATKAISLIFDYQKSLSMSLHKPKHSTQNVEDAPTFLSEGSQLKPIFSIDWDGLIDHPVSAALKYPPEKLEMLALRVASKTYPHADQAQRQGRFKRKQSLKRRKTKSVRGKNQKEYGAVHEAAYDTRDFGRGVLTAGLKAPVSLFYNLANGFHNAPSFLLGDQTVRRRDNITGFGSGVRTARKEFTYGLYDGITGVVIQPYIGARDHGITGFVTGIGRGAGGIVFKTCAAGLSLPAYTLKGLEKQFEKRKDRHLKAKILAIRLRQLLIAFERASKEEKDEVLERWRTLELDKGSFRNAE